MAITQSPTFRSLAAAETWRENVVLAFQLTATWPSGPWTCAVDPATAATLPDPPGPPPPGPPPWPYCWVAGAGPPRPPSCPGPQAETASPRATQTTARGSVLFTGAPWVIRCGGRRWA